MLFPSLTPVLLVVITIQCPDGFPNHPRRKPSVDDVLMVHCMDYSSALTSLISLIKDRFITYQSTATVVAVFLGLPLHEEQKSHLPWGKEG